MLFYAFISTFDSVFEEKRTQTHLFNEASAQNKPISGTVTDASGVPVIGAAVFVVGNTSTGVMTDMDGKFTLSVPQNAAIAVSCIGYATQTIQTGAETVYNVMLQEDS